MATIVLAAATVAYAWVATSFRPFTWPARVTTGLPAVALLAAAARWGRRRVSLSQWLGDEREDLVVPRPEDPVRAGSPMFRRGEAIWFVVFGALVGWELVSLFQSPRSLHPTISSLTNAIGTVHPAHALLFVLWLSFGWDLLRR